MSDVLKYLSQYTDAGIAVAVLVAVLALIVFGYLVTAKHLNDWREFAEKQERRADALQATLNNQTERDERLHGLLQQINQNIITGILRDRS